MGITGAHFVPPMVKLRGERVHLGGELGGPVVFLPDVLSNIEQLAAAVFVPFDELPVAVANRAGRATPWLP